MQYLLWFDDAASRWIYLVGSSPVCTRAFRSIYSTSNNRIRRAKLLYAQNPNRLKPEGRPESWMTVAVRLWLKRFFKLQCECLPNKKDRHLPDNYTKTEVFSIYVACMAVDRQDGHASFTNFLRIWRHDFTDVKIPTVNRFSQCAQCLYYKTLRDKGSSLLDKGKPNVLLP